MAGFIYCCVPRRNFFSQMNPGVVLRTSVSLLHTRARLLMLICCLGNSVGSFCWEVLVRGFDWINESGQWAESNTAKVVFLFRCLESRPAKSKGHLNRCRPPHLPRTLQKKTLPVPVRQQHLLARQPGSWPNLADHLE